MTCARCGKLGDADDRFCAGCGAALSPARVDAPPVAPASRVTTARTGVPFSLPPAAPPAPVTKPQGTGCGVVALYAGIAIVALVLIVGFFGRDLLENGGNFAQAPNAGTVAALPSPSVPSPKPRPTPKPKPTPAPTPAPTPESYEHQRQREKAEFADSVDASVTAALIAGNPEKYVGTNVELRCTVGNVVAGSDMLNATCGDDDTNIVIEYDDTGSLDAGQSIRVLGTVEEPSQGTNAFGGTMNFPTVKAEFME